MVFQQFDLFENMTALKNCVIGQVKVLGRSRDEAEKNAKVALTLAAKNTLKNGLALLAVKAPERM